MNPTTFTPNRRPDFTARAVVQPGVAPCHSFVHREYVVPLAVWGGTAFGADEPFLFDTGSDFCTVDYTFAVAHNFHLDIGCVIAVSGLTGSTPAWLTRRYVRFQHLPRLRFSFHFLVPIPQSHADHPRYNPSAPLPPRHPPLLGAADLMEAFELIITSNGLSFYLHPGHGAPITP